MLYELCTAGQVTGAAIPYVRVRCSHDALTLQHKAGAQSQSSMPHPRGSLRSPVDPLSLSFLEETEGLSDDLPAVSQLSVDPRLGSLVVWAGVIATAAVPDAPEPPGTWRQSPPHH